MKTKRFAKAYAGFKLALIVTGFLLMVSPSHGVEATIGALRIVIPAPSGFTEVRTVSKETFSVFQDLTPQTNNLLAGFITKKDAGFLIQDKDAEFSRYLLVQTFSKFEDINMSLNQFSEMRKGIRKDVESSKLISQKKINALTKLGSQKLSERYDSDISFEINESIQLGINNETATSISMSTLAKYDQSIDGKKSELIMSGTTVFLLVKGKLLYLYAFGEYISDLDLDWTREITKSWTSQIISSNETTSGKSLGGIVDPNVPIPTSVKELITGKQSEYSTVNHKKAVGLDISLSYPSSWEAKEGIRPHIVQKFTGKSFGAISPGCLIFITEALGWESAFLEKEDWETILDEFSSELVPEKAKYISGGKTHIDGEPAVWMKYYMEQERSGMSMGMFTLQYAMLYRGKLVSIQFTTVGLLGDYLVLEHSFKSYIPLFQYIGNSIVINNKWDGSTDTAEPFSEYWLFTLAISALLTWGVGMLPPVFTRFVILRRCLSKQASIIFSISFLVINIIVFTILGSESKTHASLFLVAFASFAILRYGYGDDDKERARVDAEKEKGQWEEQAKRAQKDARRAEEERQFKQKHKQERAKAENERKQWEEQAKRARENAKRAEEKAHRRKHDNRQYKDDIKQPRNAKYYARVLGLRGSVTKDQIRKRYTDLALKYHPDKVANLGDKLKETAEREMKAINEAYEYLKQQYKL